MDFVLQAREKFMSLRKSTRMDIATVVEEVRHVAIFGICIHEYLDCHGLP